MGLKVITPPVNPVTLAEARLQCRVDDTADDSLISGLIMAAQEYCQHYTQRAIGSQTLELALDEFPDGPIELPYSPATSIVSVKYAGLDSIETTMGINEYVLDDYTYTSWLIRVYGSEWPIPLAAANAVKVRYVAGAATVPSAVHAAMLLTIAHLYENRIAVEHVRGTMLELPLGVKALLDTNRVWSL